MGSDGWWLERPLGVGRVRREGMAVRGDGARTEGLGLKRVREGALGDSKVCLGGFLGS